MVLGFLLSIMNISFNSIAPTLFLVVEARFGLSTLQNYENILRNQPLGAQLSFVWRLVLVSTIALPIILSAAYKTFTGGESVMAVDPSNYVEDSSYYGMFALPGLQTLGQKTGTTLFANATLDFAQLSSPYSNGTDPPLPLGVQPYGFNILSLDDDRTALLDIPQPRYISAVQNLLAQGESWRMTASVFATVATFNHSREIDPVAYEAFFTDFCTAAKASSGAFSHMSMMNNKSIVLVDHASPGDQTLQYIGVTKDPGINYLPACDQFIEDALLYDLNRQLCEGTWSITRRNFQLVGGSCSGTALPLEKQLVITDSSMFLGVWYMSSLVELVGPFGGSRDQSKWLKRSMATATAAMVWSRITILDSAENIVQSDPMPLQVSQRTLETGENLTYEDVGLIYHVNDTVLYIRPTLYKSALLYFVLGLQPFLMVLMSVAIILLHHVPVGKGFGLISILSGISTESLKSLSGASLSGELTRAVPLEIIPVQNNGQSAIQYSAKDPHSTPRNGFLKRAVVYH